VAAKEEQTWRRAGTSRLTLLLLAGVLTLACAPHAVHAFGFEGEDLGEVPDSTTEAQPDHAESVKRRSAGGPTGNPVAGTLEPVERPKSKTGSAKNSRGSKGTASPAQSLPEQSQPRSAEKGGASAARDDRLQEAFQNMHTAAKDLKLAVQDLFTGGLDLGLRRAPPEERDSPDSTPPCGLWADAVKGTSEPASSPVKPAWTDLGVNGKVRWVVTAALNTLVCACVRCPQLAQYHGACITRCVAVLFNHARAHILLHASVHRCHAHAASLLANSCFASRVLLTLRVLRVRLCLANSREQARFCLSQMILARNAYVWTRNLLPAHMRHFFVDLELLVCSLLTYGPSRVKEWWLVLTGHGQLWCVLELNGVGFRL
jgi:hypothetical protein